MSETSAWQAPQWLTKDYLEDVLKQYLQDETIYLRNIDYRPATSKGENYASVMSRLKISFNRSCDGKIEELSFIMKCSHENDPFVSNIMSSYDVYNTEMRMYEQVLPQIANILLEVGDSDQLFAKTLKVDYQRSAILFEDLAVKQYELADRLKGLNENHSRFVMRKLAKFHAAAAVLNERLNGALEHFDRGLFNNYSRGLGCMFEYFVEVCAKYALSSPQLGSYYHDKLMHLQPHVVDYATRAYSSNRRHFFTLSHGDLWINNMMMLYNKTQNIEPQLQDVLFVDFQFSNWSSAAVDLHYFFNTSLEQEMQLNPDSQDQLVQFYHSVLSEMLKRLKFRGHIPTLHELCIQMEEARILAVPATLTNQAVATAVDCDEADFHSLVGNTERAKRFRENCYRNKRFQKVIETLLPYFDRHGLLDLQK